MQSPVADFQLLFQSSPGLYLVLAPDWTIVGVSDAYLLATMTTREAILGRPLFEVFPDNPNDPQATGVANLKASLERVMSRGTTDAMPVQKYDVRRPAHAGGEFEERFWSPVNVPVHGDDGRLRYILHQVEDVTELARLQRAGSEQADVAQRLRLQTREMESEIHQRARQLEETVAQLRAANRELQARETELSERHSRLQHSEQRFRMVVEAVRDYAIFMLDPGGNVATWNAGARRIKGYEGAEIIGQHFSRFYSPEDVRRGLPRLELETARAMGRFSAEGWRYRKDGSRFWAHVVVTALLDGKGQLLGFSKVTRDRSEQRQADENIRALSSQLARTNRELERQNEELLALHAATLAIHGDLALETVLQRIVDQARRLIDSRYGALSVMDNSGAIVSFVTSGIEEAERVAIGPPPSGHGLLAVTLLEGQRLRLADLTRDTRAVGFPANHPPMRSLLAAPVPCKGPFRGNLYLAERVGASEFSPSDEETLARFATTAALAIDNADLHRRLRSLAVAEERVRMAHELHDGTAQILAYVAVKAQAVAAYVSSGKADEAQQELAELAAAANNLQIETREAILGLRVPLEPDQPFAVALRHFVERWQDQSGTPSQLFADEDLRLEPEVRLQLLRIVQEALANVRKHARATHARVELRRGEGRVTLSIQDDGVGFAADPSRAGHFGFSTMRERAARIGAAFHFESSLGHGTRLWIHVPESAALELSGGA